MLVELALGVGNRCAVRIGVRLAEHTGHAIDQLVGDDVLEAFRLVVHTVPRVAEHIDQEQLEDAVPADGADGVVPARPR
jgi:hypothetical protein